MEFFGIRVINNIPDASTVAFFRMGLRHMGVIEAWMRCLRLKFIIRFSKHVVVRALMQRLCQFHSPRLLQSRSSATHERRKRKSKMECCQRAGMRTQLILDRGTWMFSRSNEPHQPRRLQEQDVYWCLLWLPVLTGCYTCQLPRSSDASTPTWSRE